MTLAAQVMRVMFEMPATVFDEIGLISAKHRTDLLELDEGFEQFLALFLASSIGPPQHTGREFVHCIAQHSDKKLIALSNLA
ncbi:MAG: hypothetical protein QE279_05510 [Rhodoferax sp.]|nr:hypothetical protein [Rhodoferax sp.]